MKLYGILKSEGTFNTENGNSFNYANYKFVFLKSIDDPKQGFGYQTFMTRDRNNKSVLPSAKISAVDSIVQKKGLQSVANLIGKDIELIYSMDNSLSDIIIK